MTEYRILRLNTEISAWVEVGDIAASNPKQALRLLMEDETEKLGGTYVAVPDGNWHVLRPEVQNLTRLVFK